VTEDDGGAAGSALTLLVMSHGLFASHTLPMAGVVTIGRSSTCSICIDDPVASREHARLHVEAKDGVQRLSIEDMGSANGTRVRDVAIPVHEPTPIAPGEGVVIGGTVVIVLQDRSPSGSRRLWSHVYFGARVEEECAKASQNGLHVGLARLRFAAPSTKILPRLLRTLASDQGIAQYGPHDYEILFRVTDRRAAETNMAALVQEFRVEGVEVCSSIAWCPQAGRSFDALVAAANAMLRDSMEPAAITTDSADMRRVHEMATRVANSQINVLIRGETGVGKDVLARLIHRTSSRAQKPFLALNCAGLSETLLESELFGHAKGTFTGATGPKVGLLGAADGGTVFLDEIGDMPLSIQARLLRVIEDRQIRPLGSLQSYEINVRFLSATNKDLEEAVAKREFRQDLIFRLNGLCLTIPPLRKRKDEIPVLANTFVTEACREMGHDRPLSIDDCAMAALADHGWSGNIRELKNVMERAVVLCDGAVIRLEHLELRADPARTAERPPGAGWRSLPELTDPEELQERKRIVDALDACASNQTRAAQRLKMSRRTFVTKLDYYKIPRPQKDA
jgi:DNA-binding NtrC family response regulator